jgi:phage N-6-adenine-methyltransferase
MTPPLQKPGRSKQDYATPVAFLEAVKARLGIQAFAIDLAANASNTTAPQYLDVTTNALAVPWPPLVPAGSWAWLNPPFANINRWARKCAGLRQAGGQVAFLVPASVGADWFRDWVHQQALVLLLNGRLSFLDNGKPYPKDCLLALYSPHVLPGYNVWSWREALSHRQAAPQATFTFESVSPCT